jgi:hypothetical protein
MKDIVMTAVLAFGLLAPGTVMAHDAKLHKGKATTGEVVSVGDDRFEMKTSTGTTLVSFSAKTKFEHGNQTVDKTHVSKGARVSVIGTKLPSGELVAREVMLGVSDAATDHATMKTADKEKPEHKH